MKFLIYIVCFCSISLLSFASGTIQIDVTKYKPSATISHGFTVSPTRWDFGTNYVGDLLQNPVQYETLIIRREGGYRDALILLQFQSTTNNWHGLQTMTIKIPTFGLSQLIFLNGTRVNIGDYSNYMDYYDVYVTMIFEIYQRPNTPGTYNETFTFTLITVA